MSEVRLIDANALRMVYCEFFHTVNPEEPGEDVLAVGDCVMALDAAPTIDPVRHGHWIRIVEGDEEYWKCSDCKQEWWLGYGGSDGYNYCPNCGAKMDAKDESEGKSDDKRR